MVQRHYFLTFPQFIGETLQNWWSNTCFQSVLKLIIFQFWVFLIFILCLYALQTSYPAGHPPLSLRMPFFILIDFLPSVILEHSETTTRFFFFKRLDVLQNRSSTGVNLLQTFFVDVFITRDSQRLPSLERVSTGIVQVMDGMRWSYYLIFDWLQLEMSATL